MNHKGKVLPWVITAATVLLLMMFAWQCLDIYLTGNAAANLDANGLYLQPVYQAEDVALRLKALLPWALGYGLLLLGSLMMPFLAEKSKLGAMDPDNRLRLLKKNLAELPEEAKAQEARRKKIRLGCASAIALCGMGGLFYLLNKDNFVSWDLEAVMGQMLIHVLPWVIMAFAIAIAGAYFCRRSIETEIQLLRGISGSKDRAEKAVYAQKSKWVQIFLYACAFVLILLGIENGGMRDVLVKAINICTECIGLG